MPATRMPATLTPTTPTPRKAFERALARCLDPVTAPTFLAEHWERLPLVVPRDEPGRFDDLLSEADVERLVCATAIRYPAFRLVREGGQLAVSDYASDVSWRPPFTGTADVPRVLAEWEAGATIVLQALHVNWHSLAVFCRLLEARSGTACRRTPITRRAARRASASTTTRTTSSSCRWRARRRGGSTTRSSSCRSSTSATRALSASTARRPSLLRAGTPSTCCAAGSTKRRRPTRTRST